MGEQEIVTMKKIILIRHAKSSWEHNVSDIKRPISKRGFDDAVLMVQILNNLLIDLDAIYSSDSLRTLETAKIFSDNLINYKKLKVTKTPNLYDFFGDQVDLFIKNLNNRLKTVMIFSHNNSCNNLLAKYSDIVNLHVPTTGILIFEFDVSLWEDVKKGNCNCFFPKNFK